MLREGIAAAVLLLAPAAQADPRENLDKERVVFFATEQTEFKFRWAPASGPVYGYEVCIVYPGRRRECHGTIETEYTFTPSWWVTWFIQVRAMGFEPGEYGQWSEESIWYNINPNAADANFSGGVGVDDFGILRQEWGKTAE